MPPLSMMSETAPADAAGAEMSADPEVSQLLNELRAGREESLGRLVALVYDELKRRSHFLVQREAAHNTLRTTALVHEAFIRLVPERKRDWNNRAHFVAVAAQAMRRVLCEHARRKGTDKRWGDAERVPLDDGLALPVALQPEELIALDRALTLLARHASRPAKVIELRFYGGMTIAEVASYLDINPRTVKRDWEFARAWLHRAMRVRHDAAVDAHRRAV
jgi:RNA polymerase sigma factor (TIGR02999 family)